MIAPSIPQVALPLWVGVLTGAAAVLSTFGLLYCLVRDDLRKALA